jgi:hypothetical protein
MSRARLLIAVTMMGTSLGCTLKAGYYGNDKKAALAALEVFHERLSLGDYEGIYDNASDALRAQPKSELVAALRETHERWGKFITAEVKASSCFPSEVRFIVEAQYEKGIAGELFIWHVPDDKARLQHYQIFPGAADVPAGASNECRSSAP